MWFQKLRPAMLILTSLLYYVTLKIEKHFNGGLAYEGIGVGRRNISPDF